MVESPARSEPVPEVRLLFQIYRHGVVFHFICALARIGVFDEIHRNGGEAEFAALARVLDIDLDALRRSLRLLAAHGVCEVSSGTVRLNGPAGLLVSTTEFSLNATFATPGISDVGNGVEHTVRSGRQSFRFTQDQDFWAFLQANPDRERTFHQAMREQSRLMGLPSVPLLDWPRQGTVVDIAGGSGAFLAAVLDEEPELHGILLDRPAAVIAAKELFVLRGLQGRAGAEASDLFVPPPAGDLFILSRVLHDWSDDEVRTILETVRSSARPGHRLRVLEELLGHDEPLSPEQAWSDAVMMVLYEGGHERSEEDYRKLLSETGWKVLDVYAGLPGVSVIDAVAL